MNASARTGHIKFRHYFFQLEPNNTLSFEFSSTLFCGCIQYQTVLYYMTNEPNKAAGYCLQKIEIWKALWEKFQMRWKHEEDVISWYNQIVFRLYGWLTRRNWNYQRQEELF